MERYEKNFGFDHDVYRRKHVWRNVKIRTCFRLLYMIRLFMQMIKNFRKKFQIHLDNCEQMF